MVDRRPFTDDSATRQVVVRPLDRSSKLSIENALCVVRERWKGRQDQISVAGIQYEDSCQDEQLSQPGSVDRREGYLQEAAQRMFPFQNISTYNTRHVEGEFTPRLPLFLTTIHSWLDQKQLRFIGGSGVCKLAIYLSTLDRSRCLEPVRP